MTIPRKIWKVGWRYLFRHPWQFGLMIIGIAATILSALPPAWEAASVMPRAALHRSGLENKAQKTINVTALAGFMFFLCGTLLLWLPGMDLTVSFAGTFVIIIGYALTAPIVMKWFMGGISPVVSYFWGTLGKMAPREVISSISRTSVAVAALMVAVSVTIGVSLMVSSFRYTVIQWLDQTLQGDIYMSTASVNARQPTTSINPLVLNRIENWPGVLRVDVLRSVDVDSPDGFIHIAATNNSSLTKERIFLSRIGSPTEIQSAMQKGAVLISEPLANRLNIPGQNGEITLYTDKGSHIFPVAGIYYEYASTQGSLSMQLHTYQNWWRDKTITAVALRLDKSVNVDWLTSNLQQSLSPLQNLVIRPNRELRQEVLTIFDRTFQITGALRLLAMVVAFIGILSAILSLLLERQRDLGIMRAVGLTNRQLWGLMMVETGLMGTVAGILAMPAGFALALILILIINRRSFGWTLQLHVDPAPFVLALGMSILAALLAGIYPAKIISSIPAAETLRSE